MQVLLGSLTALWSNNTCEESISALQVTFDIYN